MSVASLPDTSVLQQFQWNPQPDAERLVADCVNQALERSRFLQNFARRLSEEAAVRLVDVTDHIVLPDSPQIRQRFSAAGFTPESQFTDRNGNAREAFANAGGIFPALVLAQQPIRDRHDVELAIRVDSVPDFISAWHASRAFLENYPPLASVRVADVEHHERATIYAVERRGRTAFDAIRGELPASPEKILHHAEQFRMRPRRYKLAGFGFAHELIDAAIADLGVDYTCHLFFAAEREYWQRRNRAARVQKTRQDRLGIGWANQDHHTYRSSRRQFVELVAMWEKLGFKCRERFYAGREAGWGAQVMEQPNAGIVTFNDVDLSPDELLIDFAHEPLPQRQELGTVGLWCALHGESFLEAGMHHLECMFDFSGLKEQLERDHGVSVMKPFTDFPHLRQAFTQGERWPVSPMRIDSLLKKEQITEEQAAKFRDEGAIGSHLENLERNGGFKGFNQTGVSEIIAATDPRKHMSR